MNARSFLIVLALLFSLSPMTSQGAVRTFGSSSALSQVLDAIYDASFDFEGMYIISHNIDFLGDKKNCSTVSPQVILRHFKKIFDEFIAFYPDEELPYDRALRDLRKIIGSGKFERCHEYACSDDGFKEVTHYQSLTSDLWIRVEYNVQN